VQCLQSALKSSDGTSDAKLLDIAAKVIQDGSIKLQDNDTSSAVYRAVSDETIQKAIMACTSSCPEAGQAPRSRIEVDAWTIVHVTQLSSSKTAHGVDGAVVQIGEKTCTTHDGKCTIRLSGVNLSDEVDVQVTTADKSQVSARHKVSELIARETTMSVDPAAQRVSVIVSACVLGQALGPMAVSLAADGADTWKESCGQAFPATGQDCRQETVKNGEAKFWVLGKPSQIKVTALPEGKPPVEYDEAFVDPIIIKYPKDCGGGGTGGGGGAPPRDCPELREWVQTRLAPKPSEASETVLVSATPQGVQCKGCENLHPPASLLSNCKPFTVRRKLAR
jgi:hypothetical protein